MKILFFILMIIWGCGNAVQNSQEIEIKPAVAADKMQLILSDIHLAEGLLAAVVDKAERDELAGAYYGQILTKHGVKNADFEQSMQAYFRSPSQLATLYEKVLADLIQKEAQ